MGGEQGGPGPDRQPKPWTFTNMPDWTDERWSAREEEAPTGGFPAAGAVEGFLAAGAAPAPAEGFLAAGGPPAPVEGFLAAGAAPAPVEGFLAAGAAPAPAEGFAPAPQPVAAPQPGLMPAAPIAAPPAPMTAPAPRRPAQPPPGGWAPAPPQPGGWVPAQPGPAPATAWGTPPATAWGTPPQQRRAPASTECTQCGSSPAADLQLSQVTGMVLLWHRRTTSARLCHLCAAARYADVQARNLTLGWWGFIAPLVNLITLEANARNRRRHARVTSGRMGRDPVVATPWSAPAPTRPISARPGPWLGTAAYLLVLVALFVVPRLDGSGRSPARNLQGSCLTTDGQQVSCSDGRAVWRVAVQVDDKNSCGLASIANPDGTGFYCLDRISGR